MSVGGRSIMGARRIAVAALAVGALWTTAGHAVPSVPLLLTEQGRLTDAKDNPITTSTKLTFSIYAVAKGGTSSWSETQTITPDDGYFSAELGSVTTFPAGLFSGAELYLGVKVGADAEMTPRQAITSVPYALVANNAIGDISPNSVSIGTTQVISAAGKWVGPAPFTVSSEFTLTGDALSVTPGGITTADLGYPIPQSLHFMPITPAVGCQVGPVNSAGQAATISSTTAETVGTMFFDQAASPYLASNYTRARLLVLARGSGTITLVSGSCGTTLATITVGAGSRPWTYVSAQFTPTTTSVDYDVQVTASSGETVDYANPVLLLY
jgi:hypothetical protein